MKRIISILCILVFLVGCVKVVEKEEETVTPTPVEEEPVVVEEEAVVAEPAEDVLSGVRCTEDRIVGTITNTLDVSIDVEKDIQLFVNGLQNREFSCGKTVLQPGEATFCDTINGKYPIRSPGKNRVSAILNGYNYNEVITC